MRDIVIIFSGFIGFLVGCVIGLWASMSVVDSSHRQLESENIELHKALEHCMDEMGGIYDKKDQDGLSSEVRDRQESLKAWTI